MAVNCPKSCGKCGTATTTGLLTPPPLTTKATTTTTEATVCEDQNTNCAYWLGQGECTSEKWKDWMAVNCPKSCGKCGTATTTELLTPPPLTTTKATTTTTELLTPPPLTTTTEATNCEDQNNRCEYWSDAGYCSSDDWGEWMKENCPKSCNECQTTSTSTTTSTTTTTTTEKQCSD